MAKRISFLVHGRVQGVGFRYFTRKRAAEKSITGWVRNTSTNKVEGEAQGSLESIQTFLSEINKGPSHSNVSKVETTDIDVVEGESDFQVRH